MKIETLLPTLIIGLSIIGIILALPLLASMISSAITSMAKGADAISGIATNALTNVIGASGNLIGSVSNVMQSGIGAIQNVTSSTTGALGSATEATGNMISSTGGITGSLIQNSTQMIAKGFDASKIALDAYHTCVVASNNIISPMINSFIFNTAVIATKILSLLAKPIKSMIGYVGDIYDTIKNGIKPAISLIGGYIGDIKSYISDISGSISSISSAFGKSVADFIVNTVKNGADALYSTIKGWVENIVKSSACDWLPRPFGVHICHREDCLILINRDSKNIHIPIKDISINDMVVTQDGTLETVKYLFKFDNSNTKLYDYSSSTHPRVKDGKLMVYEIQPSFEYLNFVLDTNIENVIIEDQECNLVSFETSGPLHNYIIKTPNNKEIIFRDLCPIFSKDKLTQLLMYRFMLKYSNIISSSDMTTENYKSMLINLSDYMGNFLTSEEMTVADNMNITAAYKDANIDEVFERRFENDDLFRIFHLVYSLFYNYENHITYDTLIDIDFNNLVLF